MDRIARIRSRRGCIEPPNVKADLERSLDPRLSFGSPSWTMCEPLAVVTGAAECGSWIETRHITRHPCSRASLTLEPHGRPSGQSSGHSGNGVPSPRLGHGERGRDRNEGPAVDVCLLLWGVRSGHRQEEDPLRLSSLANIRWRSHSLFDRSLKLIGRKALQPLHPIVRIVRRNHV